MALFDSLPPEGSDDPEATAQRILDAAQPRPHGDAHPDQSAASEATAEPGDTDDEAANAAEPPLDPADAAADPLEIRSAPGEPDEDSLEDSVGEPPDPDTPVASEPPNSEIMAHIERLTGQVEALQRLFESKILHSESEGQVNARLHAELQAHKNDLYGKLVKPILQDVITVREHVLKLGAARRQRPPAEQAIDLGTFDSFADDLAQVLEDNDVEIRSSAPGAEYEPQWHQVVGKVGTTDPDAHRTIATATGDAYAFQGRALARQRVTVFAHSGSQTEESL